MYSSPLVEIHRRQERVICRQTQCGQRHCHCVYYFLHFVLCQNSHGYPSNIVQSSILICRVYKTPRRIGRALHQGNELLGIMEEEVPLLLGEASPNGLSLSSHCSFLSSDFPYIHLEVSRDFNKYRDPGLPLGNTTIQFSISMLEHTFPVLNPVVRMLYFLHKDYLIL